MESEVHVPDSKLSGDASGSYILFGKLAILCQTFQTEIDKGILC